MATLKFYINKSKKDKNGLYPVLASISSNSIRIRRAISFVKVKEEDWKKDRIKPNGKTEPYNNHIEYNAILNKYEFEYNELIKTALLKGIQIDTDYIVDGLNNVLNKNKSEDNFFDFFDKFIEVKKSDSALRTIMGYKTCRNKLFEFQENEKFKIKFSTLNLTFFDSFKIYIFNTKGHSDNYLAKLIANLKTFLKWAMDREIDVHKDFVKFKATEKPKEIIALYEDELKLLYKYDFDSKKLNQVRDVFCFGCFTGLRYSDIRTLVSNHINDNMIMKQCVKTKDILKIPLNKYAKEILSRYKGIFENKVLPIISEQKFNTYIKECCKVAGINKMTPIVKFVGGQKVEEIHPKYQLITSHTARKTFTSVSLILGMNESMVKEITNHKKDSNFRKYVVFAQTSKVEAIDNAWNNL